MRSSTLGNLFQALSSALFFSACFCDLPFPSDSVVISHSFCHDFHNIWYLSESWRSCPSVSERTLPDFNVYYSSPFSKETKMSQHTQKFQKIEVNTLKYAWREGNHTLSGLPPSEPKETRLLWSVSLLLNACSIKFPACLFPPLSYKCP